MKKGILIGSILVSAMLALAACGDNAKTIEGSAPAKEQSATTKESTSTEVTAEEQAKEPDGYYFEEKGVKITPDANMAGILEGLGEPVSYFEAASCAFEGLDKIYTYHGFEIDTYPGKDGDYISSIILKDDTVSTPEGVSIADPASKVKEVYGEPTSSSEGKLEYEKDTGRLVFVVSADQVASIEYVSKVLD